ncbi:MAG: response regulator [Candidatus Margulisiibacteriota bacterium]
MTKRILVVDDDESIRTLFECVTEDLGLHCVTASDGDEALKKFKEAGDIGLVFLDIKMPRVNGIEALQQIRHYDPDVPVTVMTGFSVDDLVIEAKNLGAQDVLYKPFDVDTLEALIHRWIG